MWYNIRVKGREHVVQDQSDPMTNPRGVARVDRNKRSAVATPEKIFQKTLENPLTTTSKSGIISVERGRRTPQTKGDRTMDKVYVLTNDNGAVIEVLNEDTYREKIAQEIEDLFADCEDTEEFADYLDREFAPSDLWNILNSDTGRLDVLNGYKQIIRVQVEEEFAAKYQECEVI